MSCRTLHLGCMLQLKVEEFVEMARGELLSRKEARKHVFVRSSTSWPLFQLLLYPLSSSCVYNLAFVVLRDPPVPTARVMIAAREGFLPSSIGSE